MAGQPVVIHVTMIESLLVLCLTDCISSESVREMEREKNGEREREKNGERERERERE